MNAEIISIGTELLLGQILNTNAQYLSKSLASIGINVYYRTEVGDNQKRLKSVFETALKRSDLIITTGGLGPTEDDLTKETIADVLGLELEEDFEALQSIKNYFEKIKVKMTNNNKKQALIPKGSIALPNRQGTAPGVLIEKNNKTVFMLPGPPNEMMAMYKEHVEPYLIKRGQGIIKSKVLKFIGIGESSLEEKIKDLLRSDNPTLAPLAGRGEVSLRITAKGTEAKKVEEKISNMEKLIRARVGKYVYGVDDETLEECVGKILVDKNQTISIAESCTGGLIADKLTNVPGISKVFDRCIVTYSNKSKIEELGVPPEILNSFGAVSKETATAMAEGIRKVSGSKLGLAVTGIAGPSGATPDKPVGLVYVALSTPENTICKNYVFNGRREIIKNRAALTALNMLRKYLINLP
ncbi:MAG: nicotinamide-nucleotide amidase [Thermosediminibacterales bacterium]|nr:nicotinamide-nucleotide amidase [Thermosediminibacterales bacterium]